MKKTVLSLSCMMLLHGSIFAQIPDYEAKKQKALTEISPFEKIAQRITPDVVLEYEDNDFIVFEPNSKQAAVHLLIVPKRRINTLNEITPDDQVLMGKMVLLAKEMAKKKGIDQTGYRITMNTNEDAGQSVFHIHLHLLGGNKIGAMVDQTYRNTQREIANKQKAEKLRAMANSLREIAQLPAVSIAVSRKGEIIFAEGFGYADVAQQKPVTPTTQFRTASVAKVITATALAKMVQDSVIDLNAPISRYIKNLPEPYQAITAKQLAGHLAGVPHYNLFTDKIENRFYANLQEALTVFLHQNLLSKPNTAYNYSTHGFTLLSAAMEGAKGQPYLEYLQKEIFAPLGMKNTEADQRQQKSYENLAKLYTVENGQFKEITAPQNTTYKWAGGGMLSTPTDLVKMTAAYSNKFLRPEIVQQVFESQKTVEGKATQVGIGWRISKDIMGREVIEHAGGMEATRTVVCLFPKEDLAVAIMVNKEWVSSIEETAHVIANLFLNETIAQSPTGEFEIEVTANAQNNKTTQKGKLVLKENGGSITLANGQNFGVFYLGSQKNYALLTTQGIYFMTIDIEGQSAAGKAIMYGTMLAESAKDNAPFFELKGVK